MSKKTSFYKYAAVLMATATTAAFVTDVPAQAQTNPFTDVKVGDSHTEAILSLYEQGIVKGVTNTQFQPTAEVTRGDAALFLANALKLDLTNVVNPNFKDVPTTSPYYKAIAALNAKKIMTGYGDGAFGVKNTLTRSQMAKIITLGFELEQSTVTNTKFTDVNVLTDANTKRYIQTLVDYGITTGTTPTTYSPSVKLKRAQLATFLYRAINITSDELEIINIE